MISHSIRMHKLKEMWSKEWRSLSLRDIFLKEGEDLLLTMFHVLEYLKRLKNDSAAAAYLETLDDVKKYLSEPRWNELDYCLEYAD